jgi:ferredoxin
VPPSSEPAAATSQAFDVRFSRSGRTLVWDGQDANLLDFADRHDLAVDSGCRSGSCGACETRLVSGTVDYADRPDHDIAKGHCLLCVGKPRSALVLEA